jgi:hypothetical protein
MSDKKRTMMGKGMIIMGKFWFAGLFAFVTVSTALAEEPADSCLLPGRDAHVCYAMKSLRSHIGLLDADRDLVRGDFELIAATSDSMYQLIAKLLTHRSSSHHLSGLSNVLDVVRTLQSQAVERNFQAYRTANQLKEACATCHQSVSSSEGASGGGTTWNEIFARSWDQIPAHCNRSGNNPFICKNMYDMATAFSYFSTSLAANHMDFVLAEKVAKGLNRTASLLHGLGGGVHESGREPFAEVIEQSEQLRQLAQRRDPFVYRQSLVIHESCGTCHQPPAVRE